MPTIHCSHCDPGRRCKNGHLYVLKLDNGSSEIDWVYVGSTTKSVEERFQDNLKRKDGSICSLEEARKIGEDGKWHYGNIPGHTREIRKSYLQHLPNLYEYKNPIFLPSYHEDPDFLKRLERELAQELEKRGFRVSHA